MKEHTNILILGDKFKKGLKSKGCPAIIKHKKTSILEEQIETFDQIFSKNKIYYVCGFEKDTLNSFIDKKKLKDKIHLINNESYNIYNDSYSLYTGLSYIDTGPVLVVHGYTVPKTSVLKKIKSNTSSYLFTSSKLKTKLGCIINDTFVDHIFYDLDNYIQDIYFLCQEDILQIKNIFSQEKQMELKNTFIFEIINLAIDRGCRFNTIDIDKKTTFCNQSKK